MFNIDRRLLNEQLAAWLKEDVGTGDVTTAFTIPAGHQSKGIIHAKEEGVIAGIPVAKAVFELVDPDIIFSAYVEEGSIVSKGTVLIEVEGSTHSILTGERLALNLMQRLSGIATKTKQYAATIADLPTELVDTRKTTPGHRALEKYAVRVGGGKNHRFGLYDAVMIKDNHIKGAGGITEAVARARRHIPYTMKVEVETESMEQVKEALQAGADIIMLDNMPAAAMAEAVTWIRSQAPHVLIEASGGITLDTIREKALAGIDVISVGSLTYSFQALDISLDLNEKKGASGS